MAFKRQLATIEIPKVTSPSTHIAITRMATDWNSGPGLMAIAWDCTFCGRRHATVDRMGEKKHPREIFMTLDTPRREA